MICMILFALLVGYAEVSALQCSEYKFSQTSYFECPRHFDNLDEIFCCGSKIFRRCCSSPDGDDYDSIAIYSKSIQTTAIVISVIVFVIFVAAIVACCCCPFCFLYKRRHRGAVHNPAPAIVQPQPGYQPVQANSPYSVQPFKQYPPQLSPVPSHPTYGLQTGPTPYPTQPAETYPTQPTQPYPTQPYPTQPTSDPPPSYSDVQPGYNPNY